MPVALISTRTSPAFGPSISIVSILSGSPAFHATAARVFIGMTSSSRRENRHRSDGFLVFIAENVKLSAKGYGRAAIAEHRRVKERTISLGFAGIHRMTEACPVRAAKFLRHDKIKFLADSIHRRIAEQRGGTRAPQLDDAVRVGNNDCVLIHAPPVQPSGCLFRPMRLGFFTGGVNDFPERTQRFRYALTRL